MADIDPTILALFGPVPPGTDLSENPTAGNDVAVAMLLVIATVAVVLRLWCRRYTSSPLKADDTVIVAALVFTYATGAMSFAVGHFGAGRHVWTVRAVDLAMAAQLLFAYSFVFAATITLTKASILLLYTRIFEVSDTKFRFLLWTAAFFVIGYPLTFIIAMANCCKPVSFYWTQFAGDTEGSCPMNTGLLFVSMAIINLFIDFFILIIPIPSILGLQMSTRKKLGVCGIMLLGGFVCCASVVRIYYLNVFSSAVDLTWYMGPVCVWSAVEPSIGILSACLPNMRPLFTFVRTKVSSSARSAGQSRTTSTPGLVTWGGSGGPVPKGAKGIQRLEEEDELRLTKNNYSLTNIVTTAERSESETNQSEGIFVRSEVRLQSSHLGSDKS